MTDLVKPDLDATSARELTDQIKGQVAELLPLIVEARERRVWVALGYASWEEYCDAELRGIRVPIEQRREAVTELRSRGMSTPAIGSALGVSHQTVQRDLAACPDGQPDVITGEDGKRYPATRPPSPVAEAVAEAIEDVAERIESTPDLRAYVDSDPEVQAAQYMRRFDTALSKALPVVEFDAERVARLAETHEVELLRRHAASLTAFADQVVRARSGLRLIQGEAR